MWKSKFGEINKLNQNYDIRFFFVIVHKQLFPSKNKKRKKKVITDTSTVSLMTLVKDLITNRGWRGTFIELLLFFHESVYPLTQGQCMRLVVGLGKSP